MSTIRVDLDGSGAVFLCAEQRGGYGHIMPYTIDRIKFLDVREWAHRYDIHYNTVMRWIKDGLPALKIGMGKRKNIYLIPKIRAEKFARKEWNVRPVR